MEYQLEIFLPTEEDTKQVGKRLAHIAKTGDVFAIYGTLGMGKSVLARGFIQELSKAEEVPSPTFTLLQTYQASIFDIYHFDLYRIKQPEEIFEIGVEEAFYSGVSLIEWPEKMGEYLPKDVFMLELKPFGSGRKLTVKTNSKEKYSRLSSMERQ